MHLRLTITLQRTLTLLGVLLVLKIVLSTFLLYPDYLPPNFNNDFLRGRDPYFWQGYHASFYVHIFSGPLSLILGLFLLSESFRRRFPKWHRILGRIQVLNVLLLVAPSGLGMAPRSLTGPVAAAAFTILSILTALTILLGWQTALQRRFNVHRRWMQRNFALLCSAVLIRVHGGLGDYLGYDAEWIYSLAAWLSWILPLLALELTRQFLNRKPPTRIPTLSPR